MTQPVEFDDKKKLQVISWWNKGYSLDEIGKAFGVSHTTISRRLVEWGIYTKLKYITVTNDDILKMVDLYSDGYSCRAIAKIFNIRHHRVSKYLKERGFDTKPIRYTANSNFFDVIDTELKANWLGFISADGTIYNNCLKICLHIKDIDHLYKFAEDINSNNPIYTNKNNTNCAITICNRKIVADLAKYGVTSKKSLTLKPHYNIPIYLANHYWRGFVDGDGSLFISKRGTPTITLCGTYDVCEAFRGWCLQYTDSNARVIKNKNIWEYKIGGKYSIPIISELYKNSSIYLDRKYETAMKILEHWD